MIGRIFHQIIANELLAVDLNSKGEIKGIGNWRRFKEFSEVTAVRHLGEPQYSAVV